MTNIDKIQIKDFSIVLRGNNIGFTFDTVNYHDAKRIFELVDDNVLEAIELYISKVLNLIPVIERNSLDVKVTEGDK